MIDNIIDNIIDMKCVDEKCVDEKCVDEKCVDEKQNDIFQLPIAYIENKAILEEHTINDLELLPIDPKDSLYKYVFNPTTMFGEKNIPLWSKYYTADTTFLKESQKLLKNKTKGSEITASDQIKMNDIWTEIRGETGFAEKYSYIEWERLSILNNSSKFLQCLSIYNMASPIFSLMLPIIFMIIPLIIIKARGLPITIEKYIELLKMVFKKHQLGQIFNLSNASFEKLIYVIASAIFYVIQIYQNIMSCRKFYYNMAKIHEQLFTVRDYLKQTIENMDVLEKQCSGLKTYRSFIEYMHNQRVICQHMLKEITKVVPNKLTCKKIGQIGHTMKCFYQLYKNNEFHEALEYSFGFNGYMDNLNGVRENMSKKYISSCKFICKKKGSATKFTDAYFPTLVHNKPVKNSYKLDKHLLITGPNAAGKTTLLKTTIFNIILSQQLGYGFYKKASLQPYDMIHCYINIPDTSARDSLFQAEAKRCKDILNKISASAAGTSAAGTTSAAGPTSAITLRHFCVFDELYSGTNPYEAISSAYAFLKYLHKYDSVNFVLTTHFLDLCKRLEKESKMHNYHMKIELINDDFKYTYKMEKGISEIKGGIKVLKDLEYPNEIINMTSDTLKELII
jgi:hypothetical protein